MKKLLSILMLILAILSFIWGSEVDLEIFSQAIMTIGTGITTWQTPTFILLGIIILKLRKDLKIMILFSWHKKLTYKLLSKWKMSKYTAMWISFAEGLLIGALIVYYF